MCACRLHLSCGRYEIKDISPPAGITAAMALQAEAERRKRASVLESEGARQAAINIAEGNKQQVVLAAEAEAEAILRRSEATATGLRSVAAALEGAGGAAAQLRVAEAYVDAFRQLAKEGLSRVVVDDHAEEQRTFSRCAVRWCDVAAGAAAWGGCVRCAEAS